MPTSIHSQEEFDFVYANLGPYGTRKADWNFLALGGVTETVDDALQLRWLDGTETDYDNNTGGTSFFVALPYPNTAWEYCPHTDTNTTKAITWPYILRPQSFVALGSELFLRNENGKLKLEVPDWNISVSGTNALTLNAWSDITLKISNGKICAYSDGSEEFSVDIPQDAQILTPDFISVGGFTGYIDEFTYYRS